MADAIEAALSAIIEELRRREMHPLRAPSLPRSPAVAIALSASEAQRFLNELVPAPLDPDDDLVGHIVGRGAELTGTEEPWVFEAVPGPEDDRLVAMGAGVFRLWITVTIPTDDLPEVSRRLGI